MTAHKSALFFCLVLSSLVFSSEVVKPPVLAQVSLGLNYPDFSSTSTTYSKQFSYLIGIGAEIPISAAFAFVPSLFYSPEWVAESTNVITTRISIVYLEVPLHIKIKPLHRSTQSFSPYILLGPSFGYLLSATQSFEGVDVPEVDFSSLLNRSRISAHFGVGFDSDIGESMAIGMSLRYATPLTSVAKSSTTSSSTGLIQGLVTMGWQYEEDVFED